MKKNQPDQRTRPELPKDPFGDFQYRQALAEEMLPMIGRIYRDNVHLLLYGKPLVNLSVSETYFVSQISQPPKMVEKWFCIQNLRMDLSFQGLKQFVNPFIGY